MTMNPSVFIVGTPIGNMEDITPRAIDTLKSVDMIFAEDTRHTRKLLTRHGIGARMVSCHKFNEAARTQQAIESVEGGATIALVTSAGMPGISDPGARLAAACREHGVAIAVVPGPSSVTAAVALSGFDGSRFLFEGFLPRGGGARGKRLSELRLLPYPVVIFESPYRCLKLLSEIELSHGDRLVFMARELTKMNEECLCGTAAQLRETLENRPSHAPERAVKGELVFVLAPAHKSEIRSNRDTLPNEQEKESVQ